MKRAALTTLLLGALTQPALAQHPAARGDDAAKPADGAAASSGADDLAKAADATAEMASLPGQPAAAGKTSSDDIDLSALGLDVNGGSAGSFDDKLNIYGFADFSWMNVHWTKSNPYVKDSTNFGFGNLNVYFAKNLTRAWRSLAEVRFMYAPNNTAKGDGTVVTTTAQDAVNISRPIEWGTISIERAYVEYDLHPRLTVRAGHWLTPYGIWNTDHGSPVITGVGRPYVIGEGLFPEHQTGLDLFGAAPLGDYKLGYHATVSNGRSEIEILGDTDRKVALGGRLELEAPWAGTLKVGASAYGGRATGATTSTTIPPVIFDELAFGGDLQWDHGGFHLQGEVLTRHKAFVEGHRAFTLTGMPQVDGDDFGTYGLVSYRTAMLWNVMPFVIVEHYLPLGVSPGGASIFGNTITAVTVGLNFRPTDNVVLKVQALYAGGGEDALVKANVAVLESQIAWVF